MSYLNSSFIYLFFFMVLSIVTFYLGYKVRNKEVRQLKRNVDELEKEIIKSQREILQLEDQLVQRIKASIGATPVITIPTTVPLKKAAK
jgi:cell division protein FtsB